MYEVFLEDVPFDLDQVAFYKPIKIDPVSISLIVVSNLFLLSSLLFFYSLPTWLLLFVLFCRSVGRSLLVSFIKTIPTHTLNDTTT